MNDKPHDLHHSNAQIPMIANNNNFHSTWVNPNYFNHFSINQMLHFHHLSFRFKFPIKCLFHALFDLFYLISGKWSLNRTSDWDCEQDSYLDKVWNYCIDVDANDKKKMNGNILIRFNRRFDQQHANII